MTPAPDGAARKRRRLRLPHLSPTNRQVWAVTIAALLAQTAHARFVGSTLLDIAWSALVAGLVAYVATTCKRGPLLVASILTVLTSQSLYAVVLALAAVLAGALSTAKIHRRAVFARGLCGAFATTSVLVSADDRVGWATAITAILVICPFAWSGMRNAPRRTRRAFAWGLGAAAVYVVGATGLAAVAIYDKVGSVDLARDQLEFGLAAARAGEIELAEQHLNQATTLAADAGSSIRKLGAPARLVPFVGQHVAALSGVLAGAEDVSDQAAITAGIASDDQLSVVNGRVDLDAVADLRNPLGRLADALADLADELDEHRAAPLLPVLDDRLAEIAVQVERAERDAGTGAAAAATVPSALGADGSKRYLVLFTSPAEARGRFGFPGSFAEVTFTDGRLLLGEQGSTSEVFARQQVDQGALDLTDPDLQPYVGYGAAASLLSATIPPDFRTVAALVAAQWEQSGREPLDGVLRFDPASLAPLLAWTGPVVDRSYPEPITAANLEQFLLFDQYQQFQASNSPRREVLDTVADVTFERLVTAELPPPRVLGAVFGPLARAGHLNVALFDDAAQALLGRTGVLGGFDAPSGDGLMIATINSAGNKIDTFLDTTVRYRGAIEDGRFDGTLQVHLANEAPAAGLPRYVIGSSTTPPLPSGTNRMTLLIYTQVEPLRATVDGTERPVRTVAAGGDRWLVEIPIDLGPGSSADVELVLGGPAPVTRSGYELRLEPGGTVRPTDYDVSIRTDDGGDAVFDGRVRSPRTVR